MPNNNNNSRPNNKPTAVASAQRVLDGGRSTKKKLASILRIAAGLGTAGLVGYAAYLARSSKFAKLAKGAVAATANARARSINGAPTTKGLLSKVKKLMGLAAVGGAVVAAKRKMNDMRMRRKWNAMVAAERKMNNDMRMRRKNAAESMRRKWNATGINWSVSNRPFSAYTRSNAN